MDGEDIATEGEVPIGKDGAGEVNADGTRAELIEATVNMIPTRKMADLRTSSVREVYP